MRRHIVSAGETLTSIARKYGFYQISKIYEHPKNKLLWEAGRKPDSLAPNDIVFIPQADPKTVRTITNQHLSFVRATPTSQLKLQLHAPKGKKLGPIRFQLELGSWSTQGVSTNGAIEVQIPQTSITEAMLSVWTEHDGKANLPPIRSTLRIGHLPPSNTTAGHRARLDNLGQPYLVGSDIQPSQQVKKAYGS